MRVKLKLYAGLGRYLPPEARGNEIDLIVDSAVTVGELLDGADVPISSCHLIVVNCVFTPPHDAHNSSLSDGDVVAVWPRVAGG